MIRNNKSITLYRAPKQGEIRNWLLLHNIKLLVAHPTCRNHDNAERLISSDIEALQSAFGDIPHAIVISDGSYTSANKDTRTIERCAHTASLKSVPLFAAPYEGYANNFIPGKGSALKMIYDEMEGSGVENVILLDGDLRNDFMPWFKAYRKILDDHSKNFPGRNAFITARYARHFVDASITRNIVGPLTTLLGTYVPGGISGDIVLSSGAVELERKSQWTESRYRYGTDIATTFDNIANNTIIYEAFLGAKLHDITDDAKLSIMPGEVIGSALERILFYENRNHSISEIIGQGEYSLKNPIIYGSDKTKIPFINPGFTDSFVLERKRRSLIDRFDNFRSALKTVLSPNHFNYIFEKKNTLASAMNNKADTPLFLAVTPMIWCDLLYDAIAYLLRTGDIDTTKHALNYLYTAAFLETCAERLRDLGLDTVKAIQNSEKMLGVDNSIAEMFYINKVEGDSRKLAIDFFEQRKTIIDRINK